jgi:electron transport complex protein RnfG
MNEIVRITVRLTLSCLVAAFFMGSVFTVTDRAKKHNEHMNVQETMLSLLGYGKGRPAPSELNLQSIYRYIVEDAGQKYLGYMVPVEKGDEERYELVLINLRGEFVGRHAMEISPEAAVEAPERTKALGGILRPPQSFTYADSFIIARMGGQRTAYLLPGEFPGFKTFITVMLALGPKFEVRGLEIMEHEEDPGLGAEIEQDYFKNQFKGKSYDKVKGLGVIKEPLPEEYRKVLETRKLKKGLMTKSQIEAIRSKYQDQDIYALTGATISSKAVTDGLKAMVTKFVYRLGILDNVIADQEIHAAI